MMENIQTDMSLQLTPVPTYTSGCVFSHLRLLCDVIARLDRNMLEFALQLAHCQCVKIPLHCGPLRKEVCTCLEKQK